MAILYEDDFMEIKESEIKNCLEIIGKKTNNDENLFKLHLQEIISQIENTGSNKIILCLDEIHFISSDLTIVRNFFPKLKNIGVKYIANVIGDSKEQQDFYSDKNKPFEMLRELFNFTVKYFNNIDQAKEWLSE
jgi:hypothetical protein